MRKTHYNGLKVAVLMHIFLICSTAQQISWIDINGQRGFSSLQESDDGTLFALQYNYVSSYSSVFYSQDTGYSWSKHTFNYNDIYRYSINGDYIIMDRYVNRSYNPHQVFLSTDRGATFSRILAEDYYWYDGITVSDSLEIFAVYGAYYPSSATYISQYKDGNWNLIGTPLPIVLGNQWDFFIDERGTFIFYGYSRFGGVIVSTDRGMTWNRSLESRNISAVSADKNNNLIAAGINTNEFIPSGLYRSTDRGITWSMLIATDDLYFSSLAVDDSGNIYGATQRNIYIYRMSSGTSEEAAPVTGGFGSILFMSDGSVIASNSDNGIYHSSDRGRSWIPHSPRAEDIFSLVISPGGAVVVGTLGNGILRSTNLGEKWNYVHPSNIPRYVFSLVRTSDDIFAGTDDGVYRSADDGIAWSSCTRGYFSGSARAVCGNNLGDIFAGTTFGIYRSADYGSSWILSGLNGIEVTLLASDSSGRIVAASPTAGIFYLDEYFENNWISIGPVLNDIQSIAINSSGDIFAGVYGGVYIRNHNTEIWQKTSFTNSFIYSLAINKDQDIIAGTYNGAFISRNNGLTWSFIPLSGSSLMSMDFDSNQNLFAGIFRRGVFRSTTAVTSVGPYTANIPQEVNLAQNYPNPFNPYTMISYSIPNKSHVTIRVFNGLGQEVALLADEEKNPGSYEVVWDGSAFSSGLYFTRLSINGIINKTIKMLLLK